jgi:hypothetical protein
MHFYQVVPFNEAGILNFYSIRLQVADKIRTRCHRVRKERYNGTTAKENGEMVLIWSKYMRDISRELFWDLRIVGPIPGRRLVPRVEIILFRIGLPTTSAAPTRGKSSWKKKTKPSNSVAVLPSSATVCSITRLSNGGFTTLSQVCTRNPSAVSPRTPPPYQTLVDISAAPSQDGQADTPLPGAGIAMDGFDADDMYQGHQCSLFTVC